MHLPAMVDLVDEQMRQQVADALGNLAVLAPVGDDAPVEIDGDKRLQKSISLASKAACASASFPASSNGAKSSKMPAPTPPSSSMSR